ncbi:MAG: glycosyltransferase family 1 protein [Planctomycetes bacterium]|nr:glycosyltransferase family 1 protein [Planctomycetota bacterium]
MGSKMSAAPLSIAHIDAERGFSGGEVQVFLLMEGLRARGHRNVLFAPPGSRSQAEAERRGLEMHAVPMRGDLDLAAVLRLKRELERAHVDLVHLHTGRATWLGGLAACWAGLAAITTRRQDRVVRRSARTRLVYGRLVRRAVAISPAVARRLAEGGVEGVVTIPSSVDARQLAPCKTGAEVRRELGLAPTDFVVLTLCALVARKGVDVLLAACARLERPCVLLIAGEGEMRVALERQAHELGLSTRARFLGARADKAELLAACDVFALASRAEGLGVAALEAMACARPVVASAVGGLSEAVVAERTGLLVAPDDVVALAAALRRLHDDPGLRARLGAAGPARLQEGFAAEQMVGAYEALYRQVLAEAG